MNTFRAGAFGKSTDCHGLVFTTGSVRKVCPPCLELVSPRIFIAFFASCGTLPQFFCRQFFLRPLTEVSRIIPTDVGDRLVIFAFRKIRTLPVRGSYGIQSIDIFFIPFVGNLIAVNIKSLKEKFLSRSFIGIPGFRDTQGKCLSGLVPFIGAEYKRARGNIDHVPFKRIIVFLLWPSFIRP